MAKDKTMRLHFDSIADMKATMHSAWTLPKNASHATGYLSGKEDGRSSWFGLSGGADGVMKALQDGHKAGEDKVTAMHQALKAKLPRAVGIGRKLVRGDTGDELDVIRVNNGQLDKAWSSRRRMIKRGKSSLRVVVDIGGNCNVNASVMQWRGVAGLCLAEIMMEAGYKTELVAGFAVRNFTRPYTTADGVVTCVVKATGTQADKGLLSASLCLSGFFRTLGFAAIVRLADMDGKEANSGLGHSVQLDSLIEADSRVSQITVPHGLGSEQAATEWIVSTVKMLQAMRGAK